MRISDWSSDVFSSDLDYAATLKDGGSRVVPELPRLMAVAAELEAMVGPIEVVLGHNDLLAANFIDDGDRLWRSEERRVGIEGVSTVRIRWNDVSSKKKIITISIR